MSRNADSYAAAIEMHNGRRNMLAVLHDLETDIMELCGRISKTDNAAIKDVAGFEMSLKELSDDAKRLAQRYAHYKNLKCKKQEAA